MLCAHACRPTPVCVLVAPIFLGLTTRSYRIGVNLYSSNMRKSLWSPDEDEKLRQYVAKHGCGNWSDVAKHTGLHRCGKSCRLRWINYLRPDLKRGPFTAHEVRLVVNLHNNLGNSWSKIATHLPGRTDNDVKNFWHSYTRSRRLQQQQHKQQRQRMEHGKGPQDDDSYDDEKPCYSPHMYNKKNTKEMKENEFHAHHDELVHHPPISMFPPNTTSINNCKVPSMNVDNNATPFHNMQLLPSTTSSSDTNMIKTNYTHHTKHLPPYSTALLPPSPINTNFHKPAMIHDLDLENQTGVQSSITANQNTAPTPSRSKLGLSYASGFHHSSHEAACSSSAVSSKSHPIDSTKSSNTQVTCSAALDAAHNWSFTFTPSMQVNYLINSHAILAEDHIGAPAASLVSQAGCSADSIKPPEGLQSVIWRFFNQQEDDPAASSPPLADHQTAHITNHQVPHHHHQKPFTTIAVSSLSRSSEPNVNEPPGTHRPDSDDRLLLQNVEDAFSSSANLQYLQAQVLAMAADCFS